MGLMKKLYMEINEEVNNWIEEQLSLLGIDTSLGREEIKQQIKEKKLEVVVINNTAGQFKTIITIKQDGVTVSKRELAFIH